MVTNKQCLDEGVLRAFLDSQLPPAEQDAVERHLARCQRCTAALAGLRVQAALVYGALGRMTVPQPSPSAAWHRFEARRAEPAYQSFGGRLQTMWQALQFRRWRVTVASALLVALLVTAMAVEPLRTAAAQFLGIFRVQQFAVVQVGPQQLGQYQDYAKQVLGNPEVTGGGSTDVTSAAQASELAGFRVLSPATLPDGVRTRTRFSVEGARSVRSQVDLATARALLKANGMPTDALPANRDQLALSARLQPVVMMEYRDGRSHVEIVQARSPEVDVPDGVNVAELAQLGLRFAGMPADQAQKLSKSVDWAKTLVIPVPSDIASVQEVPIQGTTGYLLRSQQTKSGEQMLLFWETNGVLYAVGGNVGATRLAEVAESLK